MSDEVNGAANAYAGIDAEIARLKAENEKLDEQMAGLTVKTEDAHVPAGAMPGNDTQDKSARYAAIIRREAEPEDWRESEEAISWWAGGFGMDQRIYFSAYSGIDATGKVTEGFDKDSGEFSRERRLEMCRMAHEVEEAQRKGAEAVNLAIGGDVSGLAKSNPMTWASLRAQGRWDELTKLIMSSGYYDGSTVPHDVMGDIDPNDFTPLTGKKYGEKTLPTLDWAAGDQLDDNPALNEYERAERAKKRAELTEKYGTRPVTGKDRPSSDEEKKEALDRQREFVERFEREAGKWRKEAENAAMRYDYMSLSDDAKDAVGTYLGTREVARGRGDVDGLVKYFQGEFAKCLTDDDRNAELRDLAATARILYGLDRRVGFTNDGTLASRAAAGVGNLALDAGNELLEFGKAAGGGVGRLFSWLYSMAAETPLERQSREWNDYIENVIEGSTGAEIMSEHSVVGDVATGITDLGMICLSFGASSPASVARTTGRVMRGVGKAMQKIGALERAGTALRIRGTSIAMRNANGVKKVTKTMLVNGKQEKVTKAVQFRPKWARELKEEVATYEKAAENTRAQAAALRDTAPGAAATLDEGASEYAAMAQRAMEKMESPLREFLTRTANEVNGLMVLASKSYEERKRQDAYLIGQKADAQGVNAAEKIPEWAQAAEKYEILGAAGEQIAYVVVPQFMKRAAEGAFGAGAAKYTKEYLSELRAAIQKCDVRRIVELHEGLRVSMVAQKAAGLGGGAGAMGASAAAGQAATNAIYDEIGIGERGDIGEAFAGGAKEGLLTLGLFDALTSLAGRAYRSAKGEKRMSVGEARDMDLDEAEKNRMTLARARGAEGVLGGMAMDWSDLPDNPLLARAEMEKRIERAVGPETYRDMTELLTDAIDIMAARDAGTKYGKGDEAEDGATAWENWKRTAREAYGDGFVEAVEGMDFRRNARARSAVLATVAQRRFDTYFHESRDPKDWDAKGLGEAVARMTGARVEKAEAKGDGIHLTIERMSARKGKDGKPSKSAGELVFTFGGVANRTADGKFARTWAAEAYDKLVNGKDGFDDERYDRARELLGDMSEADRTAFEAALNDAKSEGVADPNGILAELESKSFTAGVFWKRTGEGFGPAGEARMSDAEGGVESVNIAHETGHGLLQMLRDIGWLGQSTGIEADDGEHVVKDSDGNVTGKYLTREQLLKWWMRQNGVEEGQEEETFIDDFIIGAEDGTARGRSAAFRAQGKAFDEAVDEVREKYDIGAARARLEKFGRSVKQFLFGGKDEESDFSRAIKGYVEDARKAWRESEEGRKASAKEEAAKTEEIRKSFEEKRAKRDGNVDINNESTTREKEREEGNGEEKKSPTPPIEEKREGQEGESNKRTTREDVALNNGEGAEKAGTEASQEGGENGSGIAPKSEGVSTRPEPAEGAEGRISASGGEPAGEAEQRAVEERVDAALDLITTGRPVASSMLEGAVGERIADEGSDIAATMRRAGYELDAETGTWVTAENDPTAWYGAKADRAVKKVLDGQALDGDERQQLGLVIDETGTPTGDVVVRRDGRIVDGERVNLTMDGRRVPSGYGVMAFPEKPSKSELEAAKKSLGGLRGTEEHGTISNHDIQGSNNGRAGTLLEEQGWVGSLQQALGQAPVGGPKEGKTVSRDGSDSGSEMEAESGVPSMRLGERSDRGEGEGPGADRGDGRSRGSDGEGEKILTDDSEIRFPSLATPKKESSLSPSKVDGQVKESSGKATDGGSGVSVGASNGMYLILPTGYARKFLGEDEWHRRIGEVRKIAGDLRLINPKQAAYDKTGLQFDEFGRPELPISLFGNHSQWLDALDGWPVRGDAVGDGADGVKTGIGRGDKENAARSRNEGDKQADAIGGALRHLGAKRGTIVDALQEVLKNFAAAANGEKIKESKATVCGRLRDYVDPAVAAKLPRRLLDVPIVFTPRLEWGKAYTFDKTWHRDVIWVGSSVKELGREEFEGKLSGDKVLTPNRVLRETVKALEHEAQHIIDTMSQEFDKRKFRNDSKTGARTRGVALDEERMESGTSEEAKPYKKVFNDIKKGAITGDDIVNAMSIELAMKGMLEDYSTIIDRLVAIRDEVNAGGSRLDGLIDGKPASEVFDDISGIIEKYGHSPLDPRSIRKAISRPWSPKTKGGKPGPSKSEMTPYVKQLLVEAYAIRMLDKAVGGDGVLSSFDRVADMLNDPSMLKSWKKFDGLMSYLTDIGEIRARLNEEWSVMGERRRRHTMPASAKDPALGEAISPKALGIEKMLEGAGYVGDRPMKQYLVTGVQGVRRMAGDKAAAKLLSKIRTAYEEAWNEAKRRIALEYSGKPGARPKPKAHDIERAMKPLTVKVKGLTMNVHFAGDPTSGGGDPSKAASGEDFRPRLEIVGDKGATIDQSAYRKLRKGDEVTVGDLMPESPWLREMYPAVWNAPVTKHELPAGVVLEASAALKGEASLGYDVTVVGKPLRTEVDATRGRTRHALAAADIRGKIGDENRKIGVSVFAERLKDGEAGRKALAKDINAAVADLIASENGWYDAGTFDANLAEELRTRWSVKNNMVTGNEGHYDGELYRVYALFGDPKLAANEKGSVLGKAIERLVNDVCRRDKRQDDKYKDYVRKEIREAIADALGEAYRRFSNVAESRVWAERTGLDAEALAQRGIEEIADASEHGLFRGKQGYSEEASNRALGYWREEVAKRVDGLFSSLKGAFRRYFDEEVEAEKNRRAASMFLKSGYVTKLYSLAQYEAYVAKVAALNEERKKKGEKPIELLPKEDVLAYYEWEHTTGFSGKRGRKWREDSEGHAKKASLDQTVGGGKSKSGDAAALSNFIDSEGNDVGKDSTGPSYGGGSVIASCIENVDGEIEEMKRQKKAERRATMSKKEIAAEDAKSREDAIEKLVKLMLDAKDTNRGYAAALAVVNKFDKGEGVKLIMEAEKRVKAKASDGKRGGSFLVVGKPGARGRRRDPNELMAAAAAGRLAAAKNSAGGGRKDASAKTRTWLVKEAKGVGVNEADREAWADAVMVEAERMAGELTRELGDKATAGEYLRAAHRMARVNGIKRDILQAFALGVKSGRGEEGSLSSAKDLFKAARRRRVREAKGYTAEEMGALVGTGWERWIETMGREGNPYKDGDSLAAAWIKAFADNVRGKDKAFATMSDDELTRDPRVLAELARTAAAWLEASARKLGLGEIRTDAERAAARLRGRVRAGSDRGDLPTFLDIHNEIAKHADRLEKWLVSNRAKRLIDDIVDFIDDQTDGSRRPNQQERIEKRKADPLLQMYWGSVKKAMRLSDEKTEKRLKEIEAKLGTDRTGLEEAASENPDEALRNRYMLLMEAQALLKYGGLKDRQYGEIMDKFHDEIAPDLGGAAQAFADRQNAKLARQAKVRAAFVKELTDFIREHGVDPTSGKGGAGTAFLMHNVPDLFRRLQMHLHEGSEAYEWVEELRRNMSLAHLAQHEFVSAWEAEMRRKFKECFGADFESRIGELQRKRDDFDRFSRTGWYIPEGSDHAVPPDGTQPLNAQTKLSLENLMYIKAACAQKDMEENRKVFGRDEAYFNDLDATLEAELGDGAEKFIDWLTDAYGRMREQLEPVAEEVTGMRILSPDEAYCPLAFIQPKRSADTRRFSVNPFPSFLTRRVSHDTSRLDETQGACRMFEERLQQAGHYIGFARIADEVAGTIDAADVQTAYAQLLGTRVKNDVWSQLADALTGGRRDPGQLLNGVRNFVTASSLFGNFASSIKQLEGIGGWAAEMGIVPWLKGLVARKWTSAEVAEACREIKDAGIFKTRGDEGISEAMATLIDGMDGDAPRTAAGKAYKWYKRHGMDMTRLMDRVASSFMAGQYMVCRRRFYEQNGYSHEAATRAALADVDYAINETQTSGRPEFLHTAQRNGAGGKILSQFAGPRFVRWGMEVESFHRAFVMGDKGAKRKLLSRMVALHLMCGPMLALASALGRALFGTKDGGDDMEEAEKITYEAARNMVVGPMGGWFIIGNVLDAGLVSATSPEGYRGMRRYEVPLFSKLGNLVNSSAKIWKDVGECVEWGDFNGEEMDDIRKQTLRLFDMLFPVTKNARGVLVRTGTIEPDEE